MAAFVYRDGADVPQDATRVLVDPSVRFLPPQAFWQCENLEEVRLHESLENIGNEAFCGCSSLRRLVYCPSTIVWIGDCAFRACKSLAVVELAGIITVKWGAFSECNALERIGIPPRAFMIQRVGHHSYTCHLITDGTTPSPRTLFALIAPGCLSILPDSNLKELENSIRTIMNSGGEGTMEDRLVGVRQEVRKEVRGQVSAILGLAFWKAKIDEAERELLVDVANSCGSGVGGRRAKRARVLTWEAREGCRNGGKGKVIAENVLPFLDGLWGNRSRGGF